MYIVLFSTVRLKNLVECDVHYDKRDFWIVVQCTCMRTILLEYECDFRISNWSHSSLILEEKEAPGTLGLI